MHRPSADAPAHAPPQPSMRAPSPRRCDAARRMAPALLLPALIAAAAALAPTARAQSDGADTTKAIEEYRRMIQDGSAAELFEAKGEDLWKKPRGPKNASLQACDLGLGPGVVKGAFVTLPRWFADTKKVQDLESRLVTCMETLQGLDAKAIAATPFGKGEQSNLTALATWIASESRGMKFNLPQSHPEEKRMAALGHEIFFYRAGPHDFSCATCHGQPGKRIRLQDLPELTHNPGDGVGFAAWPAYRVSNGQMWGMQQRLNDCFRQQRFPYPGFGSEATIALGSYMGVNAKGAVSAAPTMKR